MDIGKLVQKAQAGDHQAFGQLYDLFSERLFRYISMKVQSRQPAEDILQETFLKAWKAMPQFKVESGNFSAWIYKIAGNAVNDYFRKIYRSPEALELDDNIELASPENLSERLDLKADLANLKQAMGQLPLNYRQVLELRFVQDFTTKETAEILGKSQLAVRLSQHRALKQLSDVIKKQDHVGYSKI